jgi:hypothetical protein
VLCCRLDKMVNVGKWPPLLLARTWRLMSVLMLVSQSKQHSPVNLSGRHEPTHYNYSRSPRLR